MKGTPAYIGMKLAEAKRQMRDEEYFKAYETISDVEREWIEQNEQIEDIDVSSSFDQSEIDEIKKSAKNPENMNPSNAEPVEKARLIVGYIDNR